MLVSDPSFRFSQQPAAAASASIPTLRLLLDDGPAAATAAAAATAKGLVLVLVLVLSWCWFWILLVLDPLVLDPPSLVLDLGFGSARRPGCGGGLTGENWYVVM